MIVESYEDVIVLTGALRSNFWETIHTAISLTLKRHPTGVIIDCSGISEITPEGAETFHDAINFVSEHERARIVVAAVPENVLSVMRSVPEVRSQLPIAASVEEARSSLDLLTEDQKEPKRKKKEPELREYDRTIVAVLTGDDTDSELLHVTKEFVSTLAAKVVLLFPILVPRNLPLQAPMPEIEKRAVDAIDAGKERLMEYRTTHEVRLERARDLPSLIQEVSQKEDAAWVIMALPLMREGSADEATRLVSSLMAKVEAPLVFVRGRKIVD
ncbi:MAG TPA: hypothetical protein VNI20_08765 [Fimbriimonadaceae bacterium]|nr:hypothetical protein [Fimbriimonadaceae bacterium]